MLVVFHLSKRLTKAHLAVEGFGPGRGRADAVLDTVGLRLAAPLQVVEAALDGELEGKFRRHELISLSSWQTILATATKYRKRSRLMWQNTRRQVLGWDDASGCTVRTSAPSVK